MLLHAGVLMACCRGQGQAPLKRNQSPLM